MYMNKTLRKHIVDTDIQAKNRVELLMNDYKQCVEEIVFNELSYL